MNFMINSALFQILLCIQFLKADERLRKIGGWYKVPRKDKIKSRKNFHSFIAPSSNASYEIPSGNKSDFEILIRKPNIRIIPQADHSKST